MQTHWFSELGVLGAVPHVDVLKVGMLDAGSKPFALQGEARNFECPSNCMSLPWVWILWEEYVSAFPTHLYTVDVDIFSFA